MKGRKKSRKKTVLISFISGKGGVGKTALTAAVGKLLAMMGYKVLLIDSDLTTHGLTFLLGFNREVQGILELFISLGKDFSKTESKDDMLKRSRLVLHISPNLDFMQSTSRAAVAYSQMVFRMSDELNEFLKTLLKYISKLDDYDFVLIDSQAGSVPSTFINVSQSAKAVTVMEPDPVSTYATKNLVGELGKSLPRESFYVLNKLSREEASAYVAIERFLKILDHLPPVPFDFEVRRAFMVRQIPIDENKPSAFMFGVIRLVRDLLPQVSERLDKLQKSMEEKALKPTEAKLEEMETQLDFLAKKEAEIEHKFKEVEEERLPIYRRIRQMMVMMTPVILLIYTIFLGLILGTEVILIKDIFVILFAIASFISSLYFAWNFYQKKPERREKIRELEEQLAILRERRSRARSEYESYRNLLVTRSEELFLRSEENENR